MICKVLPVGMLGANCVVLGDEPARAAAVIDPGGEAPKILDTIERLGLRVDAIVLTHAHIDHASAAYEVKQATGAPLYMNHGDTPLYEQMDAFAGWLGMQPPKRAAIDRDAPDGAVIPFGGIGMTVLHTPGHSPGGISLWIPGEKVVLTGDTLFHSSIGRSDLPGGDGHLLLRSIAGKLLTLPDDTLVIPGHGESTTIGRERQHNPFLQDLP